VRERWAELRGELPTPDARPVSVITQGVRARSSGAKTVIFDGKVADAYLENGSEIRIGVLQLSPGSAHPKKALRTLPDLDLHARSKRLRVRPPFPKLMGFPRR
jgi:hypothetical protein